MSSIDKARALRVSDLLTTSTYGRSLLAVKETGSTNEDAQRAAADGATDGHVIVTDTQTAGRGSRGRSWLSPPGSDLYLSIIDRPTVPLAALPPLTLAVGLGLADTVQAHLAARQVHTVAQVKWPNDIWIGGRKCAGILVEASSAASALQAVVIGIGLNVNRTEFEPELADGATSLRASDPAGAPVDRDAVLAALLGNVEGRVRQFCEQGPAMIAAEIDERLALRDRRVSCGAVRGVLRGVAPSGALRIETDAGLQDVVAGTLLLDE